MIADPAFSKVISGSLKVAAWRVNKFKLVHIAGEEWGKFYSGDCYLVFSSTPGGGNQQIFYWIGKDSSVDERATVAIKAVELDDAMGGVPVQNREKEGYESPELLSLFPEGMIRLSGGFDTGLTHIPGRQHRVKMFRVAGGRIPVLTEVEVSWEAMNHGDTFVLDTGDMIFVWRGRESSGAEGLAAARLANRLRDRMGEQLVTLEDGEEDSLPEDERMYWEQHLALKDRHKVKEGSRESDRKISKTLEITKLYRLTETDGTITETEVKTGDLHHTDLDPNDAFVVEDGRARLWVWLGVGSTQQERREAMVVGERIIKTANMGENTRLTRVQMNFEPEEFKSLFQGW